MRDSGAGTTGGSGGSTAKRVLTLLGFALLAGYLLGKRRTERTWEAKESRSEGVTVDVRDGSGPSVPGEPMIGEESKPGEEVPDAGEVRATPEPDEIGEDEEGREGVGEGEEGHEEGEGDDEETKEDREGDEENDEDDEMEEEEENERDDERDEEEEDERDDERDEDEGNEEEEENDGDDVSEGNDEGNESEEEEEDEDEE